MAKLSNYINFHPFSYTVQCTVHMYGLDPDPNGGKFQDPDTNPIIQCTWIHNTAEDSHLPSISRIRIKLIIIPIRFQDFPNSDPDPI